MVITRFLADLDNPIGGYFICKKADIPYWLHLYTDFAWVCQVVLPDATRIAEGRRKAKVDRMVLVNPQPITDFLEAEFTTKELIDISLKNVHVIPYIQSEAVLRGIIRINPVLLTHIPYVARSTELCNIAVYGDPKMLIDVPSYNQTKELCEYATMMDKSFVYLIKNTHMRDYVGSKLDRWWSVSQQRWKLGLEWS